MNYSAIHIQGNIISSEILEKIRTEDIRFQKPVDFGLHPNAPVRDEINLAWSIAVTSWSAFRTKRDSLSDTESGTSETRRYWMMPLLQQILGYELSTSNAEIINGKSYAISHRATNHDGFPIHIVGVNQSLDKRPETGGTRLSPHALVQEYINSTEHLYALVSNGRYLRLLRDATRLSRLSYLEFDLEQMMEQSLFAEFALMYRAMHATRLPERKESGADCMMEFYHQEALAAGSRIRERLSGAVENSIRELANGLLQHPENNALRQWVLLRSISPKDYYLYTLRLVYRILFLLVIEERKLIYGDKLTDELSKKRSIYYQYYSIQRLTRLAEKLLYVDPRKNDLWQSLITTFALFENKEQGSKLGISPLGSGLFAPDALGELKYQMLSNENLLRVLRYLVTFENENGQRVRVNYADLDVEEFGSVYEGLLEYDPEITDNAGQPIFGFVAGTGRKSSGSHYTPEELVKPLITHSLDYLIEERLKNPEKFVTQEQLKSLPLGEVGGVALLNLKICDVACGSGHILLSAARRVGFELAKVRSGEDQPTPTVMRMAVRDVINHCIYGVDKNPLAVELCKVALWLEAHEPGQPLNFIDHRIKCGDAIVGLAHRSELENGIADEAFKTLPGDDKDVAKTLRERNVRERKARDTEGQQLKTEFDNSTTNSVHEAIAEYKTFNQLPETNPEEIERKARAYKKFLAGRGYKFMKNLADTQVAQFFIAKTKETEKFLTTDAEYRLTIKGYNLPTGDKFGKIEALAQEKRFFHWFLEFPEVFAESKNSELAEGSKAVDTERSRSAGFDCILGNPPFLGGQKLSGSLGDDYLEFIKYNFAPIGAVDLVTFFFRRIFGIIKEKGFQSLISTNTIAQGRAREDGLDIIIANGGTINHAVKSMKWPGVAAVEVALLTITKQNWKGKFVLDGKEVKTITPYLGDSIIIGNPFVLKINSDKSFQGHLLLGDGFFAEEKLVIKWIETNQRNREVLKLMIKGEELTEQFGEYKLSWVINMKEFDYLEAKQYLEPFDYLLANVYPERQKKDGVKYPKMKFEWWKFWMYRKDYSKKKLEFDYQYLLPRVTKWIGIQKFNSNIEINDSVISIFLPQYAFPFIQSNIHEIWCRNYASTLETRLRYSPSDVFQTFPFPQHLTATQEQKLEAIGEAYHEHRRQLMLRMQLGLTKTYNAFHAKEIQESRARSQDLAALDKKTIEKQYGKEVWNLWNHLQKLSCPVDESTSAVASVCSFEEAVAGIIELRRLHVLMDEAVLEAYGWNLTPALPKGEGASVNQGFYTQGEEKSLTQENFTQGEEKSVTHGFYAQGEGSKSAIALRHDFYEVDYLPENDRVRYTIHPDARKEILKRLLELNHKIHAEEVAAGLWEKKKNSKKEKKDTNSKISYEVTSDSEVLGEPEIAFE